MLSSAGQEGDLYNFSRLSAADKAADLLGITSNQLSNFIFSLRNNNEKNNNIDITKSKNCENVFGPNINIYKENENDINNDDNNNKHNYHQNYNGQNANKKLTGMDCMGVFVEVLYEVVCAYVVLLVNRCFFFSIFFFFWLPFLLFLFYIFFYFFFIFLSFFLLTLLKLIFILLLFFYTE